MLATPVKAAKALPFWAELANRDGSCRWLAWGIGSEHMRRNGAIVAVRYNVVHNDRMFCLISSMSDDPSIQNGSPGKQCLLRVMQTVFDEGIRIFDMGSGFTDEKRHWCNVQVPLRQHYFGLTLRGTVIVKAHRVFQKTRAVIKANPQLKAAIRSLHQLLDRTRPAPADKSE